MHSALNHRRCYRAMLFAATVVGFLAAPAAAELMPADQQEALVRKYCAVCHSDAAKNGGLSLEHFEAAKASPSLMAMLLSKLTGGVLLKTASEVPFSAGAAALVDKKMKSGAMGAAGIARPDKATIDALIHAFAMESAGAMNWTAERSNAPVASAPILTVSILREIPSTERAGEAEAYRLIASCNLATQDGYVQLAWAPSPQSGTFAVSADGIDAAQYRTEGSERMGNGGGVGVAALVLAETKRGVSRTGLPFPARSLTISDLFPGETVTFPFSNLPKGARQELNACFPGADLSDSLPSSKVPQLRAGQ